MDGHEESLAQVTHDARNMVTALNLYCDLLQEPGVLAPRFTHYGGELKHVAATSRLLVEKLVALNGTCTPDRDAASTKSATQPATRFAETRPQQSRHATPVPIDNLAAELLANRNLLATLAGPTVGVTVDVEGGALPVRLAGEDLTRILVNLVKNAAEAMSSAGRVHISLWENAGDSGNISWLTLNVEDNGPGFPDRLCSNIFEPTDSAETSSHEGQEDRSIQQRGLGLKITRSLVEAAGGHIRAANRDPVGACIQIGLPVRNRGSDVASLQSASDNNASFN
jgi:signal transduction histidine kinase